MFNINNVKEKMERSYQGILRTLSGLAASKVNPDFLDGVRVEVYGSEMRIRETAIVGVIDNFTLSVSPFDKGNTKSIAKAIQDANLGVSVMAGATEIRVAIPKITEERRKEVVKVLHKSAEDGKVTIRNIRKDSMNEVKNLDKSVSEDQKALYEKEIQKLTDLYVEKIDSEKSKKEKEIMTIWYDFSFNKRI